MHQDNVPQLLLCAVLRSQLDDEGDNLINLIYYQRCSFAEAAELTGSTKNKIRHKHDHCLQVMRIAYDHLESEAA